MDGLTLRDATVDDLPELVQMIKDLNRHHNYKCKSPDEKQLVEDGFGKGGACHTIVAVKPGENGGSEIVGTISYAMTYMLSVGRLGVMSGFYIKPSYRYLGIGKQLYKQALKDVFEVHGGTFMAYNAGRDNEESKAFYKKLGAKDAFGDLKLFQILHFKDEPFETA